VLSVYYRVYSRDDAVQVKNPVDPDDQFLGRVLSIRIPPLIQPLASNDIYQCVKISPKERVQASAPILRAIIH
jgi:hypothetical protein